MNIPPLLIVHSCLSSIPRPSITRTHACLLSVICDQYYKSQKERNKRSWIEEFDSALSILKFGSLTMLICFIYFLSLKTP